MYISWLTTELVDIYVSELRTIQSLDHYLWKAGSRIHHSCLLKKEKKKRHKTDIKEKTETNTTGTPKIYYSCHKLYKPATSPHGFPQSLHCTSMFSMWLLSQQHNKNGSLFFFCSAQMFSRSCCSLRRQQPLRGAKNKNSCWFCVLILVGVLCAHVCLRRLSSHTRAGKDWTKRRMTSIEYNQRA